MVRKYRLEIVTARAGLEPFVWRFFPRLVPTTHSEWFVIYACSADAQLDEISKSLLDNWQEEEIILAYSIAELDGEQPVPNLYVTPVEAETMSPYSEEYWRQQAGQGKVAGAIKAGKQWLLPRAIVETEKRKKKLPELVIVRASGPGPSYVYIRRAGNDMSDPRDVRNHMLLSDEQERAYVQAVQFVKDGDIEAAEATLKARFEWVKVE